MHKLDQILLNGNNVCLVHPRPAAPRRPPPLAQHARPQLVPGGTPEAEAEEEDAALKVKT